MNIDQMKYLLTEHSQTLKTSMRNGVTCEFQAKAWHSKVVFIIIIFILTNQTVFALQYSLRFSPFFVILPILT